MYVAFLNNYLFLALLQETYRWYDYPGIELWKFVNLAVFATAIVIITRKYILPAMAERRVSIRRELARAREERAAAEQKLAAVEARLALLDSQVEQIRERSRTEAAEEVERIRLSTEQDAAKLREQARREIEGAGKAARLELQRYAADQSVGLAEKMIRQEIRPDDDHRIIESEVVELGSSNGGGRR